MHRIGPPATWLRAEAALHGPGALNAPPLKYLTLQGFEECIPLGVPYYNYRIMGPYSNC